MNKWVFVGFFLIAAIILAGTWISDLKLPYNDTNVYGWGAIGFAILGGIFAIFKK